MEAIRQATWNCRDYYEACRLNRAAEMVGGELRKALERRAADHFWWAIGIEPATGERPIAGSLRTAQQHAPGLGRDGA